MAPTIASTVVNRPAAEVFAYATDPTRFHEWQQGVIDGHLDQPGPAQVGKGVRRAIRKRPRPPPGGNTSRRPRLRRR
jgi:Polyketide cyclase / dehydrase and lipid transport